MTRKPKSRRQGRPVKRPPPPMDPFDLWLQLLFACTIEPLLALLRSVRQAIRSCRMSRRLDRQRTGPRRR
jgi:hypothetical protein